MLNRIKELTKENFNNLVDIRRDIHANPELGMEEYRTQELIINYLKQFGCFTITKSAKTGVVALIEGKKEGPKKCIGLRADIDALGIVDMKDVSYKSKNYGLCHACGHDVHTTVLLGVAHNLAKMQEQFSGYVKLFFQPAEERCIFEYQGVKILLLVCYDLRFPVWARNQSGSDYDIILVVANWPDIRIQYWDALIAARATENQCYIAAVNCVGDDGMGLHYNGHSVAYDTRLQPIVSFADDEEGTKIADFDIAKLHHFREVLPLWKDVDHFELKK